MIQPEGRLIEVLHTDFEGLKNDRGLWDQDLQDVVRFIRPGTSDFLRELVRGESRHYNIYDGTALWALDQFAAGLHTYNTSPTDRWFDLTFASPDLMEDGEVREWLDLVSDIIFREIGRPDVGFNQSMHESYLDLGALGTTVIYLEYDKKRNHLVFRTIPLANCYIRENHLGQVDTLFRQMEMTARQIVQRFPEAAKIEKIKTMKPNDKCKIVHAVFPSKDEYGVTHHTNKEYVSYWFCKQIDDGFSKLGGILHKGGFDDFPYLVPRWTKLAGEVYGRSPGRAALHDIRMVNEMARVIIQKADQAVNPSLEIEDDSIIGDIENGSGSIIWKEPGSAPIVPVNSGGRLDLGLEIIDRHRDQILKAFHVDWLIRQRKNERQTAYEVADERDEKLRMMSPMLGRLQVELYGPMIRRVYDLLAEEGRIPELGVEVDSELQIEYTNPAAKAQFSVKGQNARRFVEQIGLIAQFKPEVVDMINVDELATLWAHTGDVPQKVIKTIAETNQERQARAQMEANQMAAQQAPLEAKAVKDLAQAEQIRSQIQV